MTPDDLPSLRLRLRRRLRRVVKLLGWCEALADRDLTKTKAACQRGDAAAGERHLASASVRGERAAGLRQEELRLWRAINDAARAENDRLHAECAALRTRRAVRRAVFGRPGKN